MPNFRDDFNRSAPPPPVITTNLAGDVTFGFDSSTLTDAGKNAINNIMNQTIGPAPHITVVGHTDSVGTRAYNQGLSERRAASVKAHMLTRKGGAVINAYGRGEDEPIATNATAEGRAQNRRATITYQSSTQGTVGPNPFGNGWNRINKRDGMGDAFPDFALANNRMEAPGNPAFIYFRATPVPLNGVYEVLWTLSKDKSNAECIFRFTATGGRNRARLSVVIHGSSAYLAHRVGSAGLDNAPGNSEVILGPGWERYLNVDSVIRVTVTGDDIKVYDSATINPDEPVIELTTDLMKDATGIAVGNGFVDTFEIKDYSTDPVELALECDVADLEVNAWLEVVVERNDSPAYPDAVQRNAALEVPDYLPLVGIPQRLPVFRSVSTVDGMVGNETVDTGGLAPDPLSIDTDMIYRWIPRSGDFASGLWTPYVNKHSAATDFKWRLHRFNNASQTGGELQRYLNFVYRSTYGSLERRALNFLGDGALQLEGPAFSFTAMTLAFVVVPRPGPGSYGFYTQDESNPVVAAWNDPIYIGRNGSNIHTGHYAYKRNWRGMYRTTSRPNRPILVIYSQDSANGKAALLVQDQRRYYQNFSIAPKRGDDTGTYWQGWFGSRMTSASEHRNSTTMRGQLLEIAMHYDYFDQRRMLELASIMSAMYGVGP